MRHNSNISCVINLKDNRRWTFLVEIYMMSSIITHTIYQDEYGVFKNKFLLCLQGIFIYVGYILIDARLNITEQMKNAQKSYFVLFICICQLVSRINWKILPISSIRTSSFRFTQACPFRPNSKFCCYLQCQNPCTIILLLLIILTFTYKLHYDLKK